MTNIMKRHRKILILMIALIVVGIALSSAGCNGKSGQQAKTADDPIVKTYIRGAFELQLRVSSDEITIADPLILEIEATADEGIEIKLPEFSNTVGEFRIADQSGPQAAFLDGSRIRYKKTYQLKPFLSGDYTIPPMIIRFIEAGEPDEKTEEIKTKAVNIHVNSVISEDAERTLKAIMPPESLPETIIPWLAAGLAGLALVGLAGFIGFWWYNRREKRPHAIIVQPAHEIAEEELNRLFSENLLEEGYFKVFYQRLSAILRRYIEDRFGLRAPEQTTEEFLNAMRAADELKPAHKQLLKNFLIHCDQVKFAEHRPGPDEVRKMSEACRQFIADTRPRSHSGSGAQAREARFHAV